MGVITQLDLNPPQSLPPPLGQVVAEYWIEGGTAIAYPVTAGQYFQIVDVKGCQCSDLVVFTGDRHTEELDATVTRTLNGLSMPVVGLHGKYFSRQMQPLLEVIQDTCNRHEHFLLACTARYYEELGYPGHPGCSDNFNQVLRPYGIAPRPGWSAINFFTILLLIGKGRSQAQSRGRDRAIMCCCKLSAVYFAPVLTHNLVEYNGYWVPNSFTNRGVQAEYWALRAGAVLIDLSALRKFDVIGVDAFSLLQFSFSRDLNKLKVGQAAYGCLLTPHGGIVDDGIVFCLSATHYRYVGNCDSDGEWLERVAGQSGFNVEVQPCSDRLHNLAIQGPLSRQILRSLIQFDSHVAPSTIDDLPYFHFATATIATIPVLISRTGYTGELGYELFIHPQDGAALWDALMATGAPVGLQPMGMLALDLARIEAGLLAAGREFDDLTSPYQAGIGWAVALKKPDFIGKAALEKIRPYPPTVTVGLVLDGNEVATGRA